MYGEWVGLSPQEFYFHAMGGREGCIDTAVKTSETGYIQRRLVKAMETVMARYDGTLRNARGCVMQFLYGEDGMDGQRIEKQRFDTYKISAKKFKETYHLDVTADNFGLTNYIDRKTGDYAYFLNPDIVDAYRNDPEMRLLLDEEYEQLLSDRAKLREIMRCKGSEAESDDSTYLPVNIDRLLWNVQRQFRLNMFEPTSLEPKTVIEAVRRLCDEDLIVVPGDDPMSKEAQYNATLQFQMLVRWKLSSKRVLSEYRLNEKALHVLLGSIKAEFRAALVAPGEMCGVLAAQSIGEPATQMTLNTFHNTGIGAKNVTLGVPRLNELLNVARNIRTPSSIISLYDCHDKKVATDLMSKIEYTTLGDITTRAEIHYDPDPMTSVIPEDTHFVEFFMNFQQRDEAKAVSPWVLRFVLDADFISNRVQNDPNFSLADIAFKITEFYMDGVEVVYSEVNDLSGYVIRVRIIESGGEGNVEAEDTGGGDVNILRRVQNKLLTDLHLFGIKGIKKVYFTEKKNPIRWHEQNGFVKSESEWVVETDGTNIAELISIPEIDFANTTSNDVLEMFTVFGIEAGRASLFFELRAVLSFDGAYVNYRHVACLADCMCFSGRFMAVSRHGVNRSESGPMLRASFEQTVEIFMEAAAFSQFDNLNGVTENVMLGQLGRLGTGMVDLLVNYDMLANAIEGTAINDEEQLDGQFGGSTTPMFTPGMGGLGGGISPYVGLASMSPMQGAFTPADASTPRYMQSTWNYKPESPAHSSSPYMSMGGGMR